MTLPVEVEELSALLLADFTRIWELVTAELESLERSWPRTFAEREHRLNELEITVRQLMAQADELASEQLLSVLEGAFTLGALTTDVMAGVITETVPTAAAAHMAQDAMTDVLAATRNVTESTRELVQQVARDEILMHTYLGQTPDETARKIRKHLTDHGVHAVTYKNGAQHGLGSYAEMIVRTKTAEAYNAGTLQGADELDINYWEVMDGPGCGWTRHDDPVIADGLIVTTEESQAYPISHPNCRRTVVARIDIEDAADALSAGRLPDDVWESSRAAALKLWADVNTNVADGKIAQTVATRYATLSAAQQEHARLIQATAS